MDVLVACSVTDSAGEQEKSLDVAIQSPAELRIGSSYVAGLVIDYIHNATFPAFDTTGLNISMIVESLPLCAIETLQAILTKSLAASHTPAG
jgi:hypothetical protein